MTHVSSTPPELVGISNRRARRSEAKRTIALLAERFSLAFVSDKRAQRRPLKVGIHADLVDIGLDPRAVKNALRSYVGHIGYLQALARGGPRYGLDGDVAGEVTPDQVEHAAVELVRLEAKVLVKTDAARKQKAAHQPVIERAVEQPPPRRTPPPLSDSTTPKRDGLSALRRAAAARKGTPA